MLYVEDDPPSVVLVRDFLASWGSIALVIARTAEEGIAIARDTRPTAILMDVHLPGMSGTEALRVLRELPETKDIPVIAVSAAVTKHDAAREEAAGFRRCLAKPLHLDELEAELDAIFAETDRDASAGEG